MSDAPSPPFVPVYTPGALLRFPPVRRLLLANLVLFTGVALQAAAVGKEAFDISGREADLGWIGLAEFLPAALLVLVTGTVADRFNRKVVGLIAVGVEMASSVALLLYSRTNPTHVWPIFLISFGYGIGRAFQAPALRAMPPMVAPDGALPKVIALFSATWTGAVIVGPAMSGFLYAVDPWVAYAGSGLLIFAGWVSLWFVTFVRQPESPGPDQRPTVRSALEGLRFIRRTPVLMATMSLDLFAVLFGGAVALLPAIADERLGASDIAYGWLRAAPGIGAAAMAICIAIRPVRRRIGRTLLTVVGIFGVGTLVLGFTRSYLIAFLALMVLSAADMVSVFIRSSLVPLVTPDEKRGRVLAVENVFIGASNELGAFESGLAAQAFGVPATVIGGGVGTLVVVGVWAVAFPSLRNIDRFEDLAPEDPHRSVVPTGSA
ncbi:MAG: transporter [Ilumatobacteraceae bacterium]|nr:transporter [Ilumatobacteraceae bacterium]